MKANSARTIVCRLCCLSTVIVRRERQCGRRLRLLWPFSDRVKYWDDMSSHRAYFVWVRGTAMNDILTGDGDWGIADQ